MQIKEIVLRLCRRYKTRDPFELASRRNILVILEPLGSINGYYNQCYRQKFIHINSELSHRQQAFTCAHELGHAVLHPSANTPFLRANTLFSVSRLEREANRFAVELLCPDEDILEHPEYSLSELSRFLGLREELIEVKLQGMRE
jgi:Zn-dependent peptidase ImmA (M78 family)